MKLGVVAEFSFNDVVLRASPTSTLKTDFINSVLGTGVVLGSITKLAVFDASGADVMTWTISAGDWSRIAPNKIQTSKQASAPSTFTLAGFRLYSGTKVYFEATTTQQTVERGSTVRVTVTITVNIVGSATLGTLTATVLPATLQAFTTDILAGTARNIVLARARWWNPSTNFTALLVDLTKDPANRTFGHPETYYTASGTINHADIENSDGVVLIEISFSDIAVTTFDKASMSFTVSV